MDYEQIKNALKNRFANYSSKTQDGRVIVFWEDQNRDFIDDWKDIDIGSVKKHHLSLDNQFTTKHLLEFVDTESDYLIYTNINLLDSIEWKSGELPKNWLLDIVLYSSPIFRANRIDLIMDSLGINSSLRETMYKYKDFFRNKKRIDSFKRLLNNPRTSEDIERCILAVLVEIKSPNLDNIVRSLLTEGFGENNAYIADIEKYFGLDRFWQIIELHYGYQNKNKNLENLFYHILFTALDTLLPEGYLEGKESLVAETVEKKSNSYFTAYNWMDSSKDFQSYNQHVKNFEDKFEIHKLLDDLELEQLVSIDLLPCVDEIILNNVAMKLSSNIKTYSKYYEIIEERKTKHFFSQYQDFYQLLYYVIKIKEFEDLYKSIPRTTPQEIFRSYVNDYNKVDRYYRKFYLAYDRVSKTEVVSMLRDYVESYYVNDYLLNLNTIWTDVINNELQKNWLVDGVVNQHRFYEYKVEDRVEKNRIFVIVSDGLRYDVAAELNDTLLARVNNSNTKIEPLLGVLPSITKLGMASLLPHDTLGINDEGKVLVDNEYIPAYLGRKAFIERKIEDSLVFKANDLLDTNISSLKQDIVGKKLIYIYHDTIDAKGDSPSTEKDVFKACEEAIEDVVRLVNKIVSVGGLRVYITSDHGFVYQRSDLRETDKNYNEIDSYIEKSHRYTLSNSVENVSGQTRFGLSRILRNNSDLNVYVPNGLIRNRVSGSNKHYVHGGASLQEIVVPLIEFKYEKKESTEVKKVDLVLAETKYRVTNALHTINIVQNQRVGDKMVPRTVYVYFEDEDGNKISDTKMLIANRKDVETTDRIYKEQMRIENRQYDSNIKYYLVIEDVDTGIKEIKQQYTIDLGFTGGFDFFG